MQTSRCKSGRQGPGLKPQINPKTSPATSSLGNRMPRRLNLVSTYRLPPAQIPKGQIECQARCMGVGQDRVTGSLFGFLPPDCRHGPQIAPCSSPWQPRSAGEPVACCMGTGTLFPIKCQGRHLPRSAGNTVRADMGTGTLFGRCADMGTGTLFVACAERGPRLAQDSMKGRARRPWRAHAKCRVASPTSCERFRSNTP